MVRIVHFSDWHGDFRHLPEADLYVCTGDMMDNYPVVDELRDPWDIAGGLNWSISPENERIRQREDVKHLIKDGGFRQYLGSPDAPVVCVRGNHDYIDLGILFTGCNLVHEFINNERVELLGLRITGHRGIPWIYGTWNDEVSKPDLIDRVRQMPEADLFLTHYPPHGILDSLVPPDASAFRGWNESVGLEGMMNEVVNRATDGYKLDDHQADVHGSHCFGHIHECGGRTVQVSSVLFSNAATTYNVFEFEVK